MSSLRAAHCCQRKHFFGLDGTRLDGAPFFCAIPEMKRVRTFGQQRIPRTLEPSVGRSLARGPQFASVRASSEQLHGDQHGGTKAILDPSRCITVRSQDIGDRHSADCARRDAQRQIQDSKSGLVIIRGSLSVSMESATEKRPRVRSGGRFWANLRRIGI
jgi:hypothetical protein